MTVYVDSNYWIYWMDSRHPEHKYVTKSMRDAIEDGIIINLSTFIEVAHYFRGLGDLEFTSRMDELRNLRTYEKGFPVVFFYGWRPGRNPPSVLGSIHLIGVPAPCAVLIDAYYSFHDVGRLFHPHLAAQRLRIIA